MRHARFILPLLILAGCVQAPFSDPSAGAGEPPAIMQQPADQVVRRLGSATFTVRASGAGPLTYRWYRNDEPWPEWNQRSLTLVRVTENNVGVYTVTISNAAGSVTSSDAYLTLEGSPPPKRRPAVQRPAPAPRPAAAPPPPASPPGRAGTTPSSPVATEYAAVGRPLKLVATADGAGPFTYQWFRDGRPIPGATGEVFELKEVSATDAGSYACVVRNSAGETASLPIQIVVRPP
jgi:hypothetical protein